MMQKNDDKRWPQDFTKRFFIGMHMLDKDQNANVPDVLKGVKPREIVRQLADIGGDTLYFYMSCHLGNCYYPTKVKYGRKHSGIGAVDVFGEVADECRRRKIALVAVYEFYHLHYAKDWIHAPQDWKHYEYFEGSRRKAKGLCWNTGYGDFFLAQVEEVFSAYPVAGLCVDMLDYPGLNLCPQCRQRFIEEMGREPPDQNTDINAPLFKEYKMWTFREGARFLEKTRAVARKYNPQATVIQNFHWLRCEDLYEKLDANDYVENDPGSGFGYASMVNATHTSAVFRTLSEGKYPFDILYDDIVFGQLEIIPRNPYLSIASVALANGGYPVPDSMWARDGSLNPAALGLAREVYAHIDQAKKWVGNWKSLKGAGVYLSQESQYFYGNPTDQVISKESRYRNCFHGALMMLDQEHMLADVLTRRQLHRLAEYKIVYLANTVCLSEREADAFREYVRQGGTLVASYKTSLADEWGYLRENFQLADVFGVDWTGKKIEEYLAVQMQVREPEKYPFLPWENPCVTVNQAALVVKPRPPATVIADLHDRYRPNKGYNQLQAFHNAFPVAEPVGPAIVENKFGKGRCVYFAPKIFSAYAFKGIPTNRKLAARWLVERERSQIPVRLEAPGSIKLTAFERAREARWIIHLVNVQSVPGESNFSSQDKGVVVPLTEDVLPVYDLKLTLACGDRKIKQVVMPFTNHKLQARIKNSLTEITIPKVHIHEVVVVEFDKPWDDNNRGVTKAITVPMKYCPEVRTGPVKPSGVNQKNAKPADNGNPEIFDGTGMAQ